MARYKVSADVTGEVVISIEESTPAEAKSIFDENLAMTATLVDIEATKFDVDDNSITEVDGVKVEAE